MTPRRTPSPQDPEPLGELPPLDGEGEETEAPVPDLEDAEVGADEGDPFDDSTGEDDEAELDDEPGAEHGWLEDADEDEGLDVGEGDLLGEQAQLLADNDEPGVGDEDYGLGGDEASAADTDGGEEGPEGADEELREQDLPRLDADEGGSPDDEDFIDAGFGNDDGAPGVPWAARRWAPAGSPASVGPMRALACVARGAIAAGAEVVLLDLEGGCERIVATGLSGGEVTRLEARGALLAATTEDGALFTSRDGGASFAPASAWRAHVRPDEAAAGVEIALGDGELWARTAQGGLLQSADHGATFRPVDAGGFVAAVAVDDAGKLVALVRALRGAAILRGSRAALAHTPLPEDLVPGALTGRVQIAARGASIALAIEARPVLLSLDAGATWTQAPGTAIATTLAWPKEEGTLLVALYDEPKERSWLARVSSSGEARVVAEVTGMNPDVEGGVAALVCDDARGVVWLAGGFGVLALTP